MNKSPIPSELLILERKRGVIKVKLVQSRRGMSKPIYHRVLPNKDYNLLALLLYDLDKLEFFYGWNLDKAATKFVELKKGELKNPELFFLK